MGWGQAGPRGPQPEPGLGHRPSHPAAPASARAAVPSHVLRGGPCLAGHAWACRRQLHEPGPSALAYLPAAAPERLTIHLPPEWGGPGQAPPQAKGQIQAACRSPPFRGTPLKGTRA